MWFFSFLQENINIPLLNFLNSFTQNEILWNIIFIFADAPIFLIPIFLISFWIYFAIKKDNNWKEKLLFISYTTIVAILISLIIQQFVNIDRPETHLKRTWNMILSHIPDASFPSDHASVWSAFLFWILFFWFIKYFYLFAPFIIIMLISRIRAWVHWPMDIIVWIIVWLFSSFLVYKLRNLNIFIKINWFFIKIANFFKL